MDVKHNTRCGWRIPGGGRPCGSGGLGGRSSAWLRRARTRCLRWPAVGPRRGWMRAGMATLTPACAPRTPAVLAARRCAPRASACCLRCLVSNWNRRAVACPCV